MAANIHSTGTIVIRSSTLCCSLCSMHTIICIEHKVHDSYHNTYDNDSKHFFFSNTRS